MKELQAQERVQPQERTQRSPAAAPPTASDRIDRLEHDVAECRERIDELRNKIADLPD